MGSLVKELPISEMMATFEIMARFGICREDLAQFRKANEDEQRERVAGFLNMESLQLTRPGIIFDVPAVIDFAAETAFTVLLCGTTPIYLPDSFKRNVLPLTRYDQNKGKVRLVEVTAEKWSHFDLVSEIGGEHKAAVPLYHVYKALEYKERERDHAPLAAFVCTRHGKLAFLSARKIPDGWAISLAEPDVRPWTWAGGIQLVARA